MRWLNSPAAGLIGVGFSLTFWIVGGALLGQWLDGKFDTDPVWTLVLLILGLAIGLYDAIRRLMEVVKKTGRKARR